MSIIMLWALVYLGSALFCKGFMYFKLERNEALSKKLDDRFEKEQDYTGIKPQDMLSFIYIVPVVNSAFALFLMYIIIRKLFRWTKSS
jgi:hypothetical protein